MIETIHADDIIAIVRSAAHEVFSTMLNLPLSEDVASPEAEEPESFDGIVALVGIAGPWTGTGRISCSPHFACQLASALLMTPYDSVNEDVLDAVAEVANMIIGNVKTMLEEKLGPLGLSIPTVIFGRNYQTRSSGVRKWTRMVFGSNGETMEISFFIMPVRLNAHPLPHGDALQTA
jgi:chemotaxis protein CheX